VGVTHQALGVRQLRSWKKTPVDGEAEALENDLGWLEAAVFDDSMALYAMGSRGRVRGKEQRGIGFTKKKWVLLPPSHGSEGIRRAWGSGRNQGWQRRFGVMQRQPRERHGQLHPSALHVCA
jgi:hypothetical protein